MLKKESWYYFYCIMTSFRLYHDLLLENFDDGTSVDFIYESYGKFELNKMDDSECLA